MKKQKNSRYFVKVKVILWKHCNKMWKDHNILWNHRLIINLKVWEWALFCFFSQDDSNMLVIYKGLRKRFPSIQWHYVLPSWITLPKILFAFYIYININIYSLLLISPVRLQIHSLASTITLKKKAQMFSTRWSYSLFISRMHRAHFGRRLWQWIKSSKCFILHLFFFNFSFFCLTMHTLDCLHWASVLGERTTKSDSAGAALGGWRGGDEEEKRDGGEKLSMAKMEDGTWLRLGLICKIDPLFIRSTITVRTYSILLMQEKSKLQLFKFFSSCRSCGLERLHPSKWSLNTPTNQDLPTVHVCVWVCARVHVLVNCSFREWLWQVSHQALRRPHS